MTHPNAPSTERLREAEELADAILSAAGSSLKYYVREARTEIVGVAVRKLDALTQENARLREALRHMADLYIGVSMNDAAPAAMTVLGIAGYDKTILTAGDIRAARRALQGGTSDAE